MFAAGEFSLEPHSVETEVFSIDFSIDAEVKNEFLIKCVDEKVKELILVDFTVCLLLFARHIRSK